jgi:hypothetical protein
VLILARDRPLLLLFLSFSPNLTGSIRWRSSLHLQHKNGAKDMTRGAEGTVFPEDWFLTQDLAILYKMSPYVHKAGVIID